MTTNNIHFAKDGKTRYVKQDFSWQLFFFGPIVLLHSAANG